MVSPDKTAAGLERFLDSGLLNLGAKLGPIVWQLPERQRFDAEKLNAFCTALPHRYGGRRLQHALEPRHESFGDEACLNLLRKHRVSLAVSDGAGRWPVFTETTGPIVYLRLHGPDELYQGGYSASQLRHWAGILRALATAGGHAKKPRDAYVYFDNDADGRAPWDALAMADTLTR
jgi:uncharacterized protein YecE (DUF72 family)